MNQCLQLIVIAFLVGFMSIFCTLMHRFVVIPFVHHHAIIFKVNFMALQTDITRMTTPKIAMLEDLEVHHLFPEVGYPRHDRSRHYRSSQKTYYRIEHEPNHHVPAAVKNHICKDPDMDLEASHRIPGKSTTGDKALDTDHHHLSSETATSTSCQSTTLLGGSRTALSENIDNLRAMVEIEFHKVKVSIIIFIAIISQLIMYLDC